MKYDLNATPALACPSYRADLQLLSEGNGHVLREVQRRWLQPQTPADPISSPFALFLFVSGRAGDGKGGGIAFAAPKLRKKAPTCEQTACTRN
jgi:hypothetical protein